MAVDTEVPHAKTLFTIPQFPLLELRVNPDPDAAAVNVAHVPVVYHVPELIIHPSALPPVLTCSVPLPEKGAPGTLVPVGPAPVVVEVVVLPPVPVVSVAGGVVVVVPPLPDLGRYFTPVAGQLELEPAGLVGMKDPVCTEPWTS